METSNFVMEFGPPDTNPFGSAARPRFFGLRRAFPTARARRRPRDRRARPRRTSLSVIDPGEKARYYYRLLGIDGPIQRKCLEAPLRRRLPSSYRSITECITTLRPRMFSLLCSHSHSYHTCIAAQHESTKSWSLRRFDFPPVWITFDPVRRAGPSEVFCSVLL